MVKLNADADLIQIGVWMEHKGLMKTSTYVFWVIQCVITLAMQIFFLYNVVIASSDHIKNLITGGEDKELLKSTTCNIAYYHYLILIVVVG